MRSSNLLTFKTFLLFRRFYAFVVLRLPVGLHDHALMSHTVHWITVNYVQYFLHSFIILHYILHNIFLRNKLSNAIRSAHKPHKLILHIISYCRRKESDGGRAGYDVSRPEMTGRPTSSATACCAAARAFSSYSRQLLMPTPQKIVNAYTTHEAITQRSLSISRTSNSVWSRWQSRDAAVSAAGIRWHRLCRWLRRMKHYHCIPGQFRM